MALRLNNDLPEGGEGSGPKGLLVLLGEAPGAGWRWWWVSEAGIGPEQALVAGGEAPWGDVEGARVVALVPAALAPVRVATRGEMPMAQALASARLDPPGLRAPIADTHVAVAEGADGESVLSAVVAKPQMDAWLAELASGGLAPAALVPAALTLPAADASTVVTGDIGGQHIARTATVAFAGEADLVSALAPDAGRVAAQADLLGAFQSPELDLRQGAYAVPSVSWFRLPKWQDLARMAAVLALLVFAIFGIETVKLNVDAGSREDRALEAARVQFPEVTDLASAETRIRAELLRRGAGGVAFADSAPAVFAAMQPAPSIKLRNMSWRGDGTLTIRAAAPSSDALNQMLIVLQRDGWQVTVPPEIAPDATGATVADITVRAP